MPARVHASHRIEIDLPVDRCFMLFTPAGEELWVPDWQPRYLHPADGRTEAGMVFTTGHGDEATFWLLADFDRTRHRSRYLRCTPGSRMGTVEVSCHALSGQRTAVTVSYTLTALGEHALPALAPYEGERFARMIDDWKQRIDAQRKRLADATIR